MVQLKVMDVFNIHKMGVILVGKVLEGELSSDMKLSFQGKVYNITEMNSGKKKATKAKENQMVALSLEPHNFSEIKLLKNKVVLFSIDASLETTDSSNDASVQSESSALEKTSFVEEAGEFKVQSPTTNEKQELTKMEGPSVVTDVLLSKSEETTPEEKGAPVQDSQKKGFFSGFLKKKKEPTLPEESKEETSSPKEENSQEPLKESSDLETDLLPPPPPSFSSNEKK